MVEDVHAKRWNPEVKKGPMDSHVSNNVPNLPANLREAIVTMIINAGLSFKFAENPDFINVMKMKIQIGDLLRMPTADTVKRDMREKFKTEQAKVKKLIKVYTAWRQ